jgi:hypothetical protein
MHMRPYFLSQNPSSRAINKFVKDAGEDLEDILDLAEADENGRIGKHARMIVPDVRKIISEFVKNQSQPLKKDFPNMAEGMQAHQQYDVEGKAKTGDTQEPIDSEGNRVGSWTRVEDVTGEEGNQASFPVKVEDEMSQEEEGGDVREYKMPFFANALQKAQINLILKMDDDEREEVLKSMDDIDILNYFKEA